MKKLISIMLLFLFLSTSLIFAIEKDENINKDKYFFNEDKKQLIKIDTSKERYEKEKINPNLDKLKEIHINLKDKDELKKEKISVKDKNIISKSDIELINILNFDEKVKNNLSLKFVKEDNNIIYNVYGAVSRNDINTSIVHIDNMIIGVNNYTLLNEDFIVTMYVGTHNEEYVIMHSDKYNTYEDILFFGEEEQKVISEYGYITYSTQAFSYQIASHLSNIVLYDSDEYTFNFNNYYADFNSVNIDIVNNYDSSEYEVIQAGTFYSSNFDEYNSLIRFDLNINNILNTRFVKVSGGYSINENTASYRMYISFFNADDSSNRLFRIIDVFNYYSGNPPTQTNNINNVNLEGLDYKLIILENYFDNFDEITLTLDGSSYTASRGSVNDYNTYNDDILIWHDYRVADDSFRLYIESKNIDYNELVTLDVCNVDACIEETFTINVESETLINNPIYLGALPDISVSGTSSSQISLNDYFSNYNVVTLDYGAITLQAMKGLYSDSDDGTILVELLHLSDNIIVKVTGKNNVFNEEFTICAVNSNGDTCDTIQVSSSIGGTSSLDTNLLHYYKFDETSGTSVDDSVGSIDGTNNGATITTGKINNALDYDGVNDYTSLSSTIGVSGDFSFSLWFNMNSIGAGEVFLGLSSATTTYMQMESITSIRMALGSTAISFAVPTISYDTWNHLVVTRSSGNVRTYLNGVESTTGATISSTAFSINQICRYSTTHYCDGNIDEVAYWSRALNSDDVNELYNDGVGFQYPFTSTPLEEEPPIQIETLSTISLDNENINSVIRLNDYVSGFDTISLIIDNINTSTFTLGNNNFQNFTSDYISIGVREWSLMTLDYIDVDYEIISSGTSTTNVKYEFCNVDGCITLEHDILTDYSIPSPTLISIIPDIELPYNELYNINLSMYYEDYEYITTSFIINGINVFLTPSNSDSVNLGLYDVKIIDSKNIQIRTYQQDINDILINVAICNNVGICLYDSFILNIYEDALPPTPVGAYPDWVPEIPDNQKPFYALLIIVVVVGLVALSTKNESFLATSTFGLVAGLGTFLLLTYMGWIPMWIVIILIIITLLYVVSLIRGGIGLGGGN